MIVLVESMDGRWYVTTARDMTANEKRTCVRGGAMTMIEKAKLDEIAEHYDDHDISDEVEAADLTAEPADPDERMSGYSLRLPAAVLNEVRAIAAERKIKTGALLRECVEAGVLHEKAGDAVISVSVLPAAAEEFPAPQGVMIHRRRQ